jgi:heme A synthase
MLNNFLTKITSSTSVLFIFAVLAFVTGIFALVTNVPLAAILTFNCGTSLALLSARKKHRQRAS